MVAPASWRSLREFLELPRTIRCDDADRRDPAPAIGLARIPLEMHRLLAFFEGAAGMRRVAQRRDRARQCETEGGGAEERPAAKFQRPHKPQFGSFPQAPSGSDGNGPTSTRHDSVIDRVAETVTVLSCVVHNTLACYAASRCDNCELWRKYLHQISSLLGNSRKTTYMVQHGAHRSVHRTKQCTDCASTAPPSAAQCGARADLDLPAHAVAAGRLQLPASADMFGVWRRSDRTLRPVGRRMDDAGADPALPALGHIRHRQCAADEPPGARWYLPWRYGRWRGVNG